MAVGPKKEEMTIIGGGKGKKGKKPKQAAKPETSDVFKIDLKSSRSSALSM